MASLWLRWDTKLNSDLVPIVVYDEVEDPEQYGWEDFHAAVRAGLGVWENDFPLFAFQVRHSPAPGPQTPGAIRIYASDRAGEWWGHANSPKMSDYDGDGVVDPKPWFSPSCDIEVSATRFKPPSPAKIRQLIAHEVGHAIGLGHEFDASVESVMRPHLRYLRPSDQDIALLHELYGKEP